MKVITKEEEQRHYNAVVKGGLAGSAVGLVLGGAGVFAATRRFPAFRSLTVPFRAFLVASTSTFCGIIQADRSSAAYDIANNPEKKRYQEEMIEREQMLEQGKTSFQRLKEWAEDNRYPIVFACWLASMGGSFAMVNRNKYLSGAQKLVQARVYAQGLTLAVLLASFALETKDATQGKGRWETIKVLDPNDPEHKHMIEKKIHKERYAGEDQWREMVEAEEARINARKEAAKANDEKKNNNKEKADQHEEKADQHEKNAKKAESRADSK
ncbi:mitochondrial hypoxia responsive domain-containing protein [Delitschia confertaspora ATCC 74209]|uniref:Mitochondrial hypoxia responsive domain-containing protein n=1 Tax=Delitschia confertaspora ATCC 74209 TaxID=1513339 RepID=A0A9P4MVQ5_9PLEO|nr:mitochondrial hypoxia responsive domain-containing protein [Delitschia confertaspora ATCC 74209]